MSDKTITEIAQQLTIREVLAEKDREIEAKDRRIAVLEIKAKTFEEGYDEKMAQVLYLEVDNKRLRATCKDREAEIKSLSGHLEAAMERIAELNRDYRIQNDHIVKINADNERLRAALAEISHEDCVNEQQIAREALAAKENDDASPR